jgi:subtilisin family serine protease
MQAYRHFWDLAGNRGEGITVAMLDTGADVRHPAFGKMTVVADDFCAAHPGIDLDGHGTQCCGLIAQVAPACNLLAGRILVQSGSFSSDVLFTGLLWAARKGADIVCICTGERVADPDLADLVNRFAVEGRIVVAAVGNTGRYDLGAGLFPARYRQTIAVGSAEADGSITSFTELPADREVVCISGTQFLVPSLGGTYQEATGTSMSAACMAGLIALKLKQNGRVREKPIHQAVLECCDLRQSDRGAYRLLDPVRFLNRAC